MIREIFTNKCPNCGKGSIYKEKNIYFNFQKPKMYKNCSHCGFQYEKEPGFFFGAMYVSYAIGVAQAVMVAMIGMLVYGTAITPKIIPWIAITLILLSSFNMRIARIIWIYLFRKI